MKKLTFILSIFSILFLSASGYGQVRSYRDSTLINEAKTDIYTIGGAGLAGSLLGLSTLSFAERPERHLKNILTGGALGVIVGVLIVASSQVDKSQNLLATPQKNPYFAQNRAFEAPQRGIPNSIFLHFQF